MRCSLALALALLLSPAALAGWGEIVSPGADSVLVPGTTVEVVWTGVPPEVDELELLLCLDNEGGRTVRLTPQLDPRVGRATVLVPHLPSPSARLRMRVGVRGRELDGPVSAQLVIAPDPSARLATVRPHAGELWAGRENAVEARPVGSQPALRREPDDSQRHLPATTSSAPSVDLVPPTRAVSTLDVRRPSRPADFRLDCGRTPLSIPLRP